MNLRKMLVWSIEDDRKAHVIAQKPKRVVCALSKHSHPAHVRVIGQQTVE